MPSIETVNFSHPHSAVAITSASLLTSTSGRLLSAMDAAFFSAQAPRYECSNTASPKLLLHDA